MAKKIKLPLEMANGVVVRTLEELQENWDLEKIMMYYHNGRLQTWLNDRYYGEMAEKVQGLSDVVDTHELQKQLCDIFEISFTEEETVDIGAVAERNRRLEALRKITADDDALKNVDKTAFNQEELADLLDAGESVIYLVNNTFSIPLTEKNKKYVGLGDVTAIINSSEPVDFGTLKISFSNIKFDENYCKSSEPKRLYLLGRKCFEENRFEEAFSLFMKAAKLGNAQAMFDLGYHCYNEGHGVEENEAETIRWIKSAAELGHDEGQFNLGICYLEGCGVKKDETEAIKWIKLAALQKNAEAQLVLGNLYYNGNGVEEDKVEAAKWYKLAAEQGNVQAQVELGVCYDDGKGVTENKTEAVKWYQKAAEQENAEAQQRLGCCYIKAEGVPEDKEKGVKLLKMSADQGYGYALLSLGSCYFDGIGVTKNKVEGLKWIERAAEQGLKEAKNQLGVCYWSISKDCNNLNEEIKWLEKAAELGHVRSQRDLGSTYMNLAGDSHFLNIYFPNMSKNDALQLAEKWFLEAAANGDSGGLVELGDRYNYGIGFLQSSSKARKWYSKAVELGNNKEAKDKIKSLDENNEGNDGCFITTAVCSSLNKPDDCDELMTMRWYRDKLKSEDPDMKELIKEYYRTAPDIVKKIDCEPDASNIYRGLWDNSISKIYRSLKQAEYRNATLRYIDMFEKLCGKFDTPLSPDIKKRIQAVRQRN